MRELSDYIVAKQEPDIRTIAALDAETKPETVDETRWARHVALSPPSLRASSAQVVRQS